MHLLIKEGKEIVFINIPRPLRGLTIYIIRSILSFLPYPVDVALNNGLYPLNLFDLCLYSFPIWTLLWDTGNICFRFSKQQENH